MPARLRVVIADDHPAYRDGLARMLREYGIDVVAQAANGDAAIRTVDETAPHVVVMDLNMPGLSGLEATRRLVGEAPSTRVLVLTVSARDDDVSEAIEAGAHGYVLKDAPLEDVVAAIRAAAAGQAVISASVLPALPPDRPAGEA
jgi:DNA-binding NarL/FixJ family response regulator